jgi:hypothetical protein
MTPSVTPCVWLTPSPRRSKWWALRAGPVVMRARRASVPSAERVAGDIAGGMSPGVRFGEDVKMGERKRECVLGGSFQLDNEQSVWSWVNV